MTGAGRISYFMRMETIEKNLITLTNSIQSFESKYARTPGSVKLLAASKAQSADKISTAFHSGQHRFGENYVEEALKKMTNLADLAIEWHFIGRIQRNKTRKIAEHFAWVQSVCDSTVAERLNAQRLATLPPLNICIEVNISHEETKGGLASDQVNDFVKACLLLPRLKVRGLMAIPAPHTDFEANRREFHKLLIIWNQLRDQGIALDTLSMGMSHDFEAAIAEGSTMVRIGTALFGERIPKKK